MNNKKFWHVLSIVSLLAMLISPFSTVFAARSNAPGVPVSFTILHTNDFHGQLEPSGSNPGMARTADVINDVRTSIGAGNVLLLDAGDEMQGSLLSNLQQGAPTIATFNAMDYDAATFGNHEFDWGQTVLGDRVTQATYPYVSANIVTNDTGDCATAGWTSPSFVDAPYTILTVGAPNQVKVGVIGVTTPETPTITIASATAGLCFKDAADSILHYYDAMIAAGADVIVVLSHLGYPDGGYGYGIPVYGDQTLATKLNTAGKPAHLIIGGHSHTDLAAATTVGNTLVVQAHYNGRKVGRADFTVNTDGSVAVTWTRLTVSTAGDQDPTIDALIDGYVADPAYQTKINEEIGWTNVPIARYYDGDSLMGYFINDAILNDLNSDGTTDNDVDMLFNNPGGLRADISCASYPCMINYGMMFNVLPFGNQTIVGDMTGAQVIELLHQSATLFKGALQPAGIRYKFFRYSDANPGPQPYGWGAYDIEVYDPDTSTWGPIDPDATYRVGTNEFLAPAGQDGFTPFKYMTNISYWGDMLDGANRWVKATYTAANPYNELLNGRITRNGNGDNTYDAGEIVPLTVLHHNDSHGNTDKTSYVGYTQLATLIKQERLHNPGRTLLLSSGDNFQGDAMMYYFKTAYSGFASDGTVIADSNMHINPLLKAFNYMGYDAMTLGNHEFNFGKDVFVGMLSQATFPVLQANLTDDGSYGLAAANIQPYVEKDLGDIDIAILGIGNHRIPNYELPSNIPGLTFTDPIAKAQELSTNLGSTNDVVIALTHIGFTENPGSVEVDVNVDTNLAATTTGIDAIIGGHSHTDPSKKNTNGASGNYQYLPAIVGNPNGEPVVVTQAYRYNSYLGEVSMGLMPDGLGGYEVVSQTGRYISVASSTAEDADVNNIVDPYTTMLTAYNDTVLGETTAPIDALQAYTQETNGANLQADAAVHELETLHSIPVDFHLSGAMSNRAVAAGATPGAPVSLKVSDMFSLMPYENSLVVISMNGPQLKAVLERAYRNYYYYKYVPGYGGYSYYTTCMLDTNFGNQITYNDLYPALPNGHNVVSLNIGGTDVDFTDATTYYNVSTVNYLAAGSCNFNDAGVTLWPLNQIVADTQYYVRDAVIHYIDSEGVVSPAIEGRLQFVSDGTAPSVEEIVPASINPTTASSVDFTVTFSEDVTGVDESDFSLTTTGTLASTDITAITGSGDTYTVTVSTGTGSGTLRLDIPNTADIKDLASNPLGGLPYTNGQVYNIGTQVFADVLPSYWAWSWIERLYNAAITGGCATNPSLLYCPEENVSRAQIAIFLERGMNGSAFTPDPATGTVFTDVPASYWAASWIERLESDGITTGCGGGNYCPEEAVTRAQMAIFLLRAKHGASYTPPLVGSETGFDDVSTDYWAAAWIKQLAVEGITGGCGNNNFCPEQPVTRAQMAVFLVRTFNLP